MALGEIVIGTIAKSVIGNLVSQGIKHFSQQFKSTYIGELHKVISETCKEYEKRYPIEETDKIPFYWSQAIVDQFVNFRFTKKLDLEIIRNAIVEDKRIIPPTQQDINNFFDIFNEKLNATDRLKELNIEFNYKEEIFHISDFLKDLRNELYRTTNEIKSLLSSSITSRELIDEWNIQLDEIHEELKSFKAFSALKRLENLNNRINEQGVSNAKLQARLLQIKGHCLSLINRGINKDHAMLLLKIYQLQPNNVQHKADAALAYIVLKDLEKAETFAQQLLEEDEYNISAWAIFVFRGGTDFAEKLKQVPKIIREHNEFVALLYNWLLYHRHVRTIYEFNQMGLQFDINHDATVTISYRNIHFQQLLAEYLIHRYFEKDLLIRSDFSDTEARTNPDLMYAHELLKQITTLVKGSEVEDNYQQPRFYYHCISFMLLQQPDDVTQMEAAYQKLDKSSLDITLKMMQAYNSVGTLTDREKAIKVIDDYTGPQQDMLFLIKAGNYAILRKKEAQTTAFIQYLDSSHEINRAFLINFTSFIWHQGVERTEEKLTASVERILKLAEKGHEGYRAILQFFCFFQLGIGNYSDAEIQELIKKAEINIESTDLEVSIHIAMGYGQMDQFIEAKRYLEPVINYDKPSETLRLYCKILYNLEGEKVRLTSILKKLRENFEPDFVLLHMEFKLMIIQNDWKEAAVIAKLGIDKFESHEIFVHGLFVAMFKEKDLDGIKENISLIADRTFPDERHVINITNALIAAEAYEESLEFLFRHASDKKNLECRQAFIALSIKYPEGYWKQFPTVEVGHFVKYTSGGVSRILEITDERRSAIPEKYLLGKSIHETFSVPGGMMSRFTEVRIERIMDKHVALMDEIMEEARNPMSGMKLQTFTFDTENPSAFIEMLKENFGAEGDLQRESTEKELEAFRAGQISFTEVTASVFRRNYIDAYFILTHSGSQPFRVISPAINQGVITEHTIFIADFTALLLLFELDKEKKIVFTSPIVIANSTLHFVEELIEEARTNPFPRMSVSVFQEHIEPHFYANGSQEQRVSSLQSLLSWMQSHCTTEKAPEMIEYLASLTSEQQQQSGFMRCMLENRLLTDKPNHVLVTNDLFAAKHLKMGLQQMISPTKFLKQFYNEQFTSCLDFMLKRNYVGIPITHEILKEEFIQFLSGNPNKYTICLDNLSFYWNPDLNLVPEALKFIKEHYTTSLITPDKRSQTVLSVFQHLVSHMQKEHLEFTRNMLQDEFALLGPQLMEVQMLLLQALRMR